MEHILGKGWQISPAGGATGEAYIAQCGDEKIFLKRNSSPFLAVLSAEGIVPKLIWTKRLENGDVITAQRWLNGRELKAADMKKPAVAQLLNKIHSSSELLNMLKRIGKQPLLPENILDNIENSLSLEMKSFPVILKAVSNLKAELPYIQHESKVVCHCDVNHNNWLLSQEKQLYLIDWDGAMIADPALDLALLLYWYIPENEWQLWMDLYGYPLTENLQRRMKWYILSQTILWIIWHNDRNEQGEVDHWHNYLYQLLNQ